MAAESSERLTKKLERSGETTLDFFRVIPNDQWQIEIYSDGPAWKMHNVFAHIVEVEYSIPRLVRHIRDGGNGVPEDFDIDQYNKDHVEEISRLSWEELLAEFPQRRKKTIDLVASLSEEELAKIGRHPFLGLSELREMIRLLILHHRLHERDISKVLEQAAASA